MVKMTPVDPSQNTAPPHLLKARLGQKSSLFNADALAKAEAALKALSSNFTQWMSDEIAKLDAARAKITELGFNQDTADQLYAHVHDLKGLGATYEFPLVTRVAASLCVLMSERTRRPSLPLSLIDAHIEAVRAIVRDDIRDPQHPVGDRLAAALEASVADYAPTEARSSSTGP
jgi:chemotaxis protein histidine kinase CheA